MSEMTDADIPPLAPDNSGRIWLITLADLISLLLTFFVLLFSMSNVPQERWDKLTDTLSRSLGPSEHKAVNLPMAQFNIGTIFRRQAINLDYLSGVLKDTIRKEPALARSQIIRYDDRVILALPGDLLFEGGRAAMSERAEAAVFALGGVLRNLGNQIVVNGHSDSTPPAGAEYVSNWELSIARAAAVANALRRTGYVDDIVATGFSDSRYSQLPDVPDAERRSLARRVDVVIMANAGD